LSMTSEANGCMASIEESVLKINSGSQTRIGFLPIYRFA